MTDAEQVRALEVSAIYCRFVDDDVEVLVSRMTFAWRLSVGLRGGVGPEDGYCYKSMARALEAAAVWSGEGDPLDGWHRHVGSGRRREDGDPARETQAW